MVHHLTPRPAQNRLEAWESLLGGCAAYDHLDFTFTPDDPSGSGEGPLPHEMPRAWFDGRPLRRQFSYLSAYASELDLAALEPSLLTIQRAPASAGAVAMRTTDSRVVVVYLADLRPFDAGFGASAVGGALDLGGLLAAARYAPRALDPKTGEWTELPEASTTSRGSLRVEVPAFREDALLHLEAAP
jgi:hypothetical protein